MRILDWFFPSRVEKRERVDEDKLRQAKAMMKKARDKADTTTQTIRLDLKDPEIRAAISQLKGT